MLRQFRAVNFQSHERIVIDFEPVTVIVGPSDCGKSSLIRAMGLVALNRPSGDAFVRTGTDFALCRLTTDEHTVIRKRGKNVNTYKLDGQEFKAFGVDTPVPIRDALKLGDINFQWQMDAPFWFSDTGGNVSRRLNEIINLGSIDVTLAAVATALTKSRSAVEFTEKRLTTASQAREELRWVKEFDADLRELEALDREHAALAAQHADLADLLATLRSSQADEEILRSAAVDGQRVIAAGDQLHQANQSVAALAELLAELKRLDTILKLPVPDDLDAILVIRKEGDELAESARELEATLDQLKASKELECELNSKLAKAREDLASLEQMAPTYEKCGQPLPSSGAPTCTLTSRYRQPGPKLTTSKSKPATSAKSPPW